MKRYKVVSGRVIAQPGEFVEMDEAQAKKFGERLEEVKKSSEKSKQTLHVQPAKNEGVDNEHTESDAAGSEGDN